MDPKTEELREKINIDITYLRAEHVEEVFNIETLSFSTPWPRISFFEELQNDLAYYLVALSKQKIIGYAGMWVILDEVHITNLAVHPDYRKLGVGERLLAELIFRSVLLGAKRMSLEVRPSNKAALRLYKKMGFFQKGRRKGYYIDNNEDALIMWKELNC